MPAHQIRQKFARYRKREIYRHLTFPRKKDDKKERKSWPGKEFVDVKGTHASSCWKIEKSAWQCSCAAGYMPFSRRKTTSAGYPFWLCNGDSENAFCQMHFSFTRQLDNEVCVYVLLELYCYVWFIFQKFIKVDKETAKLNILVRHKLCKYFSKKKLLTN